MARRGIFWRLFLFCLLALPQCLWSQSKKSQDHNVSCATFVQRFYDWYVPKMAKHGSEVALKYKGEIFSRELVRALKQDYAASAKNSEEVVGLDFDPFLNTQDPDEHYVTGAVLEKEGRCRVDVYGVSSGKREDTPAVQPDLALTDGRWIFVNFHYPGLPEKDSDLLSVLAKLSQERKQPAKK